MADKTISELVAAQGVTPTDMFVLEQNGTAKKLTGQVLENWLVSFADGHGGIQDYYLLKTVGLVKTFRFVLADQTYMDIDVVDGRGIESLKPTATNGLEVTYTVTYNDGTTDTFTVTNGEKGEKGDTANVWIKYASQEPTAESHSFGDVPDVWIGISSGHLTEAPTDWQQYQWYQWKGAKGDPGEPATLESSSVTYQAGDSGTVIPSGTWSASIPTVAQGKYLWTKTVYTFNTGEPVTQYSVARFGIDGSGAVSTVNGVGPDSEGNVALDAASVKALALAGGTMEGPINMNGQELSGLNAPTADDEAANKGYVDQHTNPPLPGVIYPYSGANIPDGFLLCDGAAYSRTEYAELFVAIGTLYGEGDGSTTFNVPDLVERVPAGAGDNHAAGEMVGEETHKLTMNELPKHAVAINIYAGSGSESGGILDYSNAAGGSQYGTPSTIGGNKAHNIMQPTTFIRGYIIATGKGSGVSVQDIITGVQALPLGIEYGGTGATNAADARKNLGVNVPNYAHNSDFTQLVAQAGIGGLHGTQAYAGDRWILDSGTVTGDAREDGNGYTNITLNGTIRQIVANPPDVGTAAIEMVSGTADISYADGQITITSSGGVIGNVRLFKGNYTADNMPDHQPKWYGTELLQCLWYYRRYNANVIVLYPGHITGTTRGTFHIGFAPFRTVPTVIMSSDFKIAMRLGSGGYSSVTGSAGAKPTAVVACYTSGRLITIYFEYGSSPGTNNMVITNTIADGYLELSADL